MVGPAEDADKRAGADADAGAAAVDDRCVEPDFIAVP